MIRRLTLTHCGLLLVVGFLGCEPSLTFGPPANQSTIPTPQPDPDPDTESDTLEVQVKKTLEASCHRCHGAPGQRPKAGVDVLNVKRLIEDEWIIPGKPDESGFLSAIESGEMPPRSAEPKPTAEEIAAIRKWILEGAKEWPSVLELEASL